MKQIILLLTNKYRNLKLKYKLIVFISIIMFSSLFLVIIGFQYAFTSYDEQIYQKSSLVLSLSSSKIEDELKNIEEVTYSIMTDNVIHDSLVSVKDDVTKYEMYKYEREIWERLTNYVGSERYIQSIHLFDVNGTEYRAGEAPSSILYEHIDELIAKSEEKDGSNAWVSLEDSKRTIFSARKLKEYKNVSLEKIGTLVIEVNLDDIVKGLPSEWGGNEGEIMISKGTEIFYNENPLTNLDKLDFSVRTKQGYRIQEIFGRSYFITHSTSPYEKWTYWNVIPFGTMFAKVIGIKLIILFIFLTLFSYSIFLVIKFSNRITNPIENLVSAMISVQQGDFKLSDNFATSKYDDEVGILHRNFYVMIERINQLIKQNYEKQLLIKDTEFKALQSQINPHFLYNTLESINWLAKTNHQSQISKMVESLGFLLRNAISLKDDVITFREEMEIVNHYVTIQKFRFEERLDFHTSIANEIKDASLPKLVVQPLVENAINYALGKMIEPCKISVSAFENSGNLHIIVEDSGIGLDEQQLLKVKSGEATTNGNGIGLSNIDARIKFVFGDEYGLKFDSKLNVGTIVSLVMPIQYK